MTIVGNSKFTPVPVLSIHMGRTHVQNPEGIHDFEYTHTQMESYYILPEDAMSGGHARKMSFLEAINMFQV